MNSVVDWKMKRFGLSQAVLLKGKFRHKMNSISMNSQYQQMLNSVLVIQLFRNSSYKEQYYF